MALSLAVSTTFEEGRGKEPPSLPAPDRGTTSKASVIAASLTPASRESRSTTRGGAPGGVTTFFSTTAAAFAGSEGGSAALVLEISFVGFEPELMPAADFPLPTGSGALRNNKGIAIRNIDYQGLSNTTANTHPSCEPNITGGRRRFDEGADALPDDRFMPPAGVLAVPEGAEGVSVVACSDLDLAAFAAAASAFVLSSSSFEVNNCSTVRPASSASKAKSACAI